MIPIPTNYDELGDDDKLRIELIAASRSITNADLARCPTPARHALEICLKIAKKLEESAPPGFERMLAEHALRRRS